MRVFISWSGDNSHEIAEELYKWMPSVIQSIVPYISSNDIEKGARWASDLAAQLEGTHFGVVCLLSENRAAPWIQFEAGALSKSLDRGKVAPILFGVDKAELANNPLLLFNCTDFTKKEMLKLMRSINNASDEPPLKGELLDKAFELNWPSLETAIANVMAKVASAPAAKKQPLDDKHEKALEEVTGLVREQLKRLLGMEEAISQLTRADVRQQDTRTMLAFGDALHDLCLEVGKNLDAMELGLKDAPVPETVDWRLKRVRTAVHRLTAAMDAARERGTSTQALKAIMPDIRRALAALH
jgi:hypothetical protein